MQKNVVITGTSKGIGFELVKLFSDRGYHVIALSRDDSTVKALRLNSVTAFSFDLSKDEDITNFGAYLQDNRLAIDILINNAGYLIKKPFSELNTKDFEMVYRVNVFGLAALTRVVLPFMSEDGHVVSVSSMGGVQGSMKFPGLAAYSSAKAAVITLTELLAEEYKDSGPSFNVLALGAVQTEMLEAAFPGYVAPVTAIQMAEYIAGFAEKGHKLYNGKLLQVSNTTP